MKSFLLFTVVICMPSIMLSMDPTKSGSPYYSSVDSRSIETEIALYDIIRVEYEGFTDHREYKGYIRHDFNKKDVSWISAKCFTDGTIKCSYCYTDKKNTLISFLRPKYWYQRLKAFFEEKNQAND